MIQLILEEPLTLSDGSASFESIVSEVKKLEIEHQREINVQESTVKTNKVNFNGQLDTETAQMVIAFVSSGGALATIGAVKSLLTQWLKNKSERKITITEVKGKNSRSIVINGDYDIDKSIILANKYFSTAETPAEAPQNE